MTRGHRRKYIKCKERGTREFTEFYDLYSRDGETEATEGKILPPKVTQHIGVRAKIRSLVFWLPVQSAFC